MFKTFTRISLAAVFAVCAFAGDVTGKWTAEREGPNGKMVTTFDFKANGAVLDGTVSTQRGDQKISEGKIEGDKISFVVVRERNGETMKQAYTGVLAGEDLKLTTQFRDMPIEMVAKRVK